MCIYKNNLSLKSVLPTHAQTENPIAMKHRKIVVYILMKLLEMPNRGFAPWGLGRDEMNYIVVFEFHSEHIPKAKEIVNKFLNSESVVSIWETKALCFGWGLQ